METKEIKKGKKMRDMVKLSFGEEIGNAVTHGVFALAALIMLPISAVYSYNHYGMLRSVGVSIYVICIFFMLLISCIYHSMDFGSTQKYVFRKLDHIAIYFAIAGSFTPICLYLLNGWQLVLILSLQWGATLAGILLKSISKYSYPKLSMVIYMAMGWAALFVIPAMLRQTSIWFLILILAGGLMYTIGAIFYGRKKPYAHFIWHIFINLACLLHFIGIVFVM